MKVTLVRHAQTEDNFLGKIQGRENSLLNDTGRRQAQRLRGKLLDEDFACCYSSPLLRTFETAFTLVGDRCEIIRDDRLLEREMGELENRPKEEYNAFQFWNYDKNRLDYGVEPVQDLMNRLNDFLSYLKEKYPDKKILIVTHMEVYRGLRHLLTNKPLKGNLLDGFIDNCSYEEFTL